MPARAYPKRFAIFLSAAVPFGGGAPFEALRGFSDATFSWIPKETRHAARSNSGLVKPWGSPLRPDLASSHTVAKTSAVIFFFRRRVVSSSVSKRKRKPTKNKPVVV
jgi:hypothetical protein